MKLTVADAMIRKNITENGDTEVFVLKNLLTYGAVSVSYTHLTLPTIYSV